MILDYMKYLGFAALFGLVGCAATATGSSRSAVLTDAVPVALTAEAPAGAALVIIRYPAVVETDAASAYRGAYLSRPIGGVLRAEALDSPDAEQVADSAVVKSNYFALSLYKELAQRLPEHSVLLSPHAVKLDEDGTLTSEPITQAESLASVLTVDFAAYSFPDPERMMQSEPITFGDLVTPLVTVRTDHRAATPTNGVLLASQPLLGAAGGQGASISAASLGTLQAGRLEKQVPALDFVSYIAGDPTDILASRSLTLSGVSNAVQSYPVEKILLDKPTLQVMQISSSSDLDPLESVFSDAMANRIVDLLNDTDTTKAAMMQRAAAISQFDPSLAALTLTGSGEEDYQARVRYAERLLDAERRYLSIQSLRIFDGIHNGEMGAQVRDMLNAEYQVLEERRELARQQNQATALAVIGVVAAVGVAASGGNTQGLGERQVRNLGSSVLLSGAIYAASQAVSLNQLSKSVGVNYLTSIVPALEEQISVNVNLLESNETITAIRFEDLQEKLQTLYTENQRSLDTIATSCAYNHTGDVGAGTWLGVCNGGVGDGAGVGVIRYDDGGAIEYIGTTQNGRPHGGGLMIFHNASGENYAIEGPFVNGQANGIMKVARAGEPDRLRTYRAGKDVSSAPADTVFVSPFQQDTTDAEPAGVPIAALAVSRQG
ncbi:MAG: hypothetical protein ABJG15_17645 [Hyphomonadaceae bacterium]